MRFSPARNAAALERRGEAADFGAERGAGIIGHAGLPDAWHQQRPAIQYALSRWDSLARYAADGRLAIDNNVAERALRTVAITPKNFLFLGSEAGGERAAILYTVLEAAKLNGLDPEAYLADVIDRMARGHPINRLGELLPWNWQQEAAKLAA